MKKPIPDIRSHEESTPDIRSHEENTPDIRSHEESHPRYKKNHKKTWMSSLKDYKKKKNYLLTAKVHNIYIYIYIILGNSL